MAAFRIVFTQHAEQMLIERSIERDWIERTIATPDIVESDPDRPDVFRAFKRIPERGDRLLRVAYVRTGETVRVVTAFFDRKRVRKRL